MQHTGLARIVVSTWLTVSLSMLLAGCQPQTPVQPTETVIIATAKPPATTTPFITIIIPPTTTATPTKTQETSMPVETTIKITAAQLYAAYVADPVAADALYKGKVVEVTGVIKGYGDLLQGRFLVIGDKIDPTYKRLPDGTYSFVSGITFNWDNADAARIPAPEGYNGWVAVAARAYAHGGSALGKPATFSGHVQGFDKHVILTP